MGTRVFWAHTYWNLSKSSTVGTFGDFICPNEIFQGCKNAGKQHENAYFSEYEKDRNRSLALFEGTWWADQTHCSNWIDGLACGSWNKLESQKWLPKTRKTQFVLNVQIRTKTRRIFLYYVTISGSIVVEKFAEFSFISAHLEQIAFTVKVLYGLPRMGGNSPHRAQTGV